jgi:DNA-binding transcriptional LysR family regulator
MKLDQLKTFYVVARTGSFTKAAEEMNVDQSSVSRKVIDLEARTKVRLFTRLARGLMLTREGEELLVKTRHILNEIEALKNFSCIDEAPSGVLKVASTTAIASMFLVDYIPSFLEAYPGIQLSLIGHDQELDLTAREADVAVCPYVLNAPNLCQKYLMTCRFHLYAGPEYLEKFGVPEKPEDLANHRLLCFGDWKERPYGAVNWLLQVGSPFGKLHKPFFRTNTMHALMKAAHLNLGIAAFCEQSICLHQGLVKVLPDVKGPEIDIFYVYPKELTHSKFITCFGDHMEQVIPPEYRIRSTPS